MKIKKRVRQNQTPNDTHFGWKNNTPLVRIFPEELKLIERLGISVEDYAKSKMSQRNK
jgi:hypothetical protein